MRLFLIRHGRTQSNVDLLLDTAAPGAPLDTAGLDQADSLVGRLAGTSLDAIYASDRVRTQQTAAPLATALGLTVTVLPELGEIAAGEDEMSADWDRYIGVIRAWGEGDLGAKIDGGEDARTFMGRYDSAINTIATTGHDAAAAVSHGAALRSWIAARVRGIDPDDQSLDAFGNTAVMQIEGDPVSGWDLVSWDGGAQL